MLPLLREDLDVRKSKGLHLCLYVSLTLLSACSGPSSEMRAVTDRYQEKVIDRLREGDYSAVSSMFSEPDRYTSEQASEDRARLALALRALFNSLGSIESIAPVGSSHTVHLLGLSGGDLAYWQSSSEFKILLPQVFEVEFARGGRGIIELQYLEKRGIVELRSMGIGMLASTQGGREMMVAAVRDMVRAQDPERSPEEVARLAEQLIGSSK